MTKKFGVMGATGQLGRKVVNALLTQGIAAKNIVACVRTPEKAKEMKGIQVQQADYDKIESLEKAFAGIDTLLLLPSMAPVEHRIVQHRDAVAAAKTAGVKRVLFSSLTTAFPESKFLISPFLVYAEMKLRQSGLDWTILRNGMYLDPLWDWYPELKEMGYLPYPVKEGKVAYISRSEIARATAAAMLQDGHEGKIYELTGPEALTMEELAQTLSEVTGQKIVFKNISDEEYAEICRSGVEDVSEALTVILTSIYWAVDNGEFGTATNHIELLAGSSVETVKDYFQKRANESK